MEEHHHDHDDHNIELEEKARILDSKLRNLRQNLERTGQVMMELEIAKNGIVEMQKGGKDVMMNFGSGVMAKAKILSDEVITPIGSGYYAAMPYEKAMEKIDRHLILAKKNQENINGEVRKVEKELIGLLKEARGSNV